MNKTIDFKSINTVIVQEIMTRYNLPEAEALNFLNEIRSWCLVNVTHKRWSNDCSKAKAVTTYGLKHVCEREFDKYIANNWIKAALYTGPFAVKKSRDKSPITLNDMFDNTVNFYFKIDVD